MNETVIARVHRPGLKVEPISLSEWREYVQGHPRLRLREDGIRIQIQTGQVIEFPPQPGNVELFWNGDWNNAFWWNRDPIRFKIPSACNFDDPKDPFWSMVIELCSHFGGLIRDEFEDDWHDPTSGKKVMG